MSTELTELSVTGHEGKSLAELMGVSVAAPSGPSIARLNLVQSPMMGEVEVNGKKLRTEVIGVGAFRITMQTALSYGYSHSVSSGSDGTQTLKRWKSRSWLTLSTAT